MTRYKVKQDEELPEVGEVVPVHTATFDTIKNDNIRKRRRVNFLIMKFKGFNEWTCF